MGLIENMRRFHPLEIPKHNMLSVECSHHFIKWRKRGPRIRYMMVRGRHEPILPIFGNILSHSNGTICVNFRCLPLCSSYLLYSSKNYLNLKRGYMGSGQSCIPI